MIRRPALLLIIIVLAACGASARERTLKSTYVTLAAAQAGFETYDREHQETIAKTATSEAAGLAQLAEYHARRAPVLDAFEIAYRTLAAAAIVSDDPKSTDAAVKAAKQLEGAIAKLTGGGQ